MYGPTRIHYEAIEPVAESFVGLDSAIDARIDSPTVNGDYSKWTGFHRIEMLMWAKHTLKGAPRFANLLLADIQTLNQKVPTLPLSATQLINGSVGLLNEIVNTKITGEEDRYSHTDLSDFQGNLLGARKAFEYVRPAMERTGQASLAVAIAQQFKAVQLELNGYRRNTPLGFALYGALTEADKITLARQVGNAAQSLSAVALKLALTHERPTLGREAMGELVDFLGGLQMAAGRRSSKSATISSALRRVMPHRVASLTMRSAVTRSAFCTLSTYIASCHLGGTAWWTAGYAAPVAEPPAWVCSSEKSCRGRQQNCRAPR